MEIKLDYTTVMDLSGSLIDFYDGIDTITDYYLIKKEERVNTNNYSDISNLIFNEVDVNPMDMKIGFEIIEEKEFNNFSTQIATFPIESQIGRRLVVGVKELNTNKYLGFTRISSPVSSIKPRNDFFGTSIPISVVNQHFYNGQTIVPVQPFGYNYLGGKLISLICLSNEVKELYNKKYDTDISVFETTSLYGTTKQMSMYDGLEPYIKYYGLTQSKNILTPTDTIYQSIKEVIKENYGREEFGGRIVNPKGSSPKTREYNEILKILKYHLKDFNIEDFNRFNTIMKTKSVTKEQKRYYMSFFGIQNIREHLLNSEQKVILNEEKYDFDNIVSYWKRKSHKRWEKLKQENKLQTELQIYNKETLKEDIKWKTIR